MLHHPLKTMATGNARLKDKVNAQLLAKTNTEFWLILSLFVLAGFLNFAVSAHRMVLGFYSLPTLFSAYAFGRRHAVLTAFASIFLVGIIVYQQPHLFNANSGVKFQALVAYPAAYAPMPKNAA